MSATVHIVGVRNLDAKFEPMLQLKLLCEKLCINYPDELKSYFGTNITEDANELREVMSEIPLSDLEDVIYGAGVECGDGMFINLTKLPKDICGIRVSMS